MRYTALSTPGKIYIAFVVAAGGTAIGCSISALYFHPVGYQWFTLAALTLLSGSITIRIPSVPATISVSETFVFTSILLFGPSAGTITVALDGLVISLWLQRRVQEPYKTLFNMAAPAVSIWAAAHIFYFVAGVPPLSLSPTPIGELLPALLLLTVIYFLLNSWLMALAVSCEKPLTPLQVWRDNFLWVSLNFFGGASVAILLVSLNRQVTLSALAVIVPLLVISYLTFKSAMGRVEDTNEHLEQLNTLYLSTIETLAMAIDAKDQITHGHIRRVQQYAIGLARAIGIRDERQIKAIEAAALLHDMGKLAVPEYILNKPGKLTAAEFEKMKLHASVGADILSAIEFPYPVVPIVRHHHENWDGKGYPSGLSGTDIPIGARILSVVDCFDALTSDRPYRPKLTTDEALQILLERRGVMYDPLIVDTFVAVHDAIAPKDTELKPQKHALLEITKSTLLPINHADSTTFDDASLNGGEEILKLHDLVRSFGSDAALSDIGDLIAKHLTRLVPASLCVFYVYNSTTDDIVAAHAHGEGSAIINGLRIEVGDRLSGWVAANKQSIANSDPVLDLGRCIDAISPRLKSCLCAPMITAQGLVGVLSLYSPVSNAFGDEQRRTIELLARQISMAIARSADFERTRRRSLHDAATGLPNHEYLKRMLTNEVERGSLVLPFSLLVIARGEIRSDASPSNDIQRTRRAIAFSNSIRRALRVADILFRYDENEFVVLLSGSDARTADSVKFRLLESVGAERVIERESSIGGPTLSIGVATAPEDGELLGELLETARSRCLLQSFPPYDLMSRSAVH